jgi:hypothetical protein
VHHPNTPVLELDPTVGPAFGRDHAQTSKLERDGDSKKSHPAPINQLRIASGDLDISTPAAGSVLLFAACVYHNESKYNQSSRSNASLTPAIRPMGI